jgi:DNA-binding GntR family transcriptional regulator
VYTTPHASRALRSDVAYDELKRQLLAGDFPLNVRLGEERLALALARTPIREALLRLHAEGLVRRGGDGGYEPIAPDVRSIRHLYEVRASLELQALRRPERSGAVHDQDLVDELRDDWCAFREEIAEEPDPAFVLLDETFQITLAEAAGNPVVADLLRQVNERIRIVRSQDFMTGARIRQTIDEHIAISPDLSVTRSVA